MRLLIDGKLSGITPDRSISQDNPEYLFKFISKSVNHLIDINNNLWISDDNNTYRVVRNLGPCPVVDIEGNTTNYAVLYINELCLLVDDLGVRYLPYPTLALCWQHPDYLKILAKNYSYLLFHDRSVKLPTNMNIDKVIINNLYNIIIQNDKGEYDRLYKMPLIQDPNNIRNGKISQLWEQLPKDAKLLTYQWLQQSEYYIFTNTKNETWYYGVSIENINKYIKVQLHIMGDIVSIRGYSTPDRYGSYILNDSNMLYIYSSNSQLEAKIQLDHGSYCMFPGQLPLNQSKTKKSN